MKPLRSLFFALRAFSCGPSSAARFPTPCNTDPDTNITAIVTLAGDDGARVSPTALAQAVSVAEPVRRPHPGGQRPGYAVEASQNFTGWQALATNTVSGGQFQFNIQSPNPPFRFFRARQVP